MAHDDSAPHFVSCRGVVTDVVDWRIYPYSATVNMIQNTKIKDNVPIFIHTMSHLTIYSMGVTKGLQNLTSSNYVLTVFCTIFGPAQLEPSAGSTPEGSWTGITDTNRTRNGVVAADARQLHVFLHDARLQSYAHLCDSVQEVFVASCCSWAAHRCASSAAAAGVGLLAFQFWPLVLNLCLSVCVVIVRTPSPHLSL